VQARLLLRLIVDNARDMLPIVLVIGLFQVLVIDQPLPDLPAKIVGGVFVLLGLTLFVRGLAMSLFPLGEALADALSRRANIWLLLLFAFALGFGSTVAEPALLAVAMQAADAAAATGLIGDRPEEVERYAAILRYTASGAVGLGVMLGTLRVILGWPAAWLVLGGYGLAVVIALVGRTPLSGVAFDAGAAATSAINIPLMAALGVGLATVIRGRNPLIDGFGIMALASVMPALAILLAATVLG